ncbi:CHAT domain-containing tetratricopeptide repeat protein [Bernardetia sp. ABR2-2B]|uniref:CHAT domain-containing protein n=1 Tax=Bernardetia sp. ABR2-2B TaxID=3127472 RepID=UPI0030D2E388
MKSVFLFTLLLFLSLLISFPSYSQNKEDQNRLDSLNTILESLSWKELDSIGKELREKYELDKSKVYLKKALQVAKKQNGKDSLYIVSCKELGVLYYYQGNYKKTEPLWLEAKDLQEKILGNKNFEYARITGNLASVYVSQGLYQKAEPLYIETGEIIEKLLGKEHYAYAIVCNNLAAIYYKQGFYEKAELLFIEAKNIREKTLGKEHPEYAISCNNLAVLYGEKQELYQKAEALNLEAKNIREKTLGKEHPEYASSCTNLAILYLNQGLYQKAEPLYIEAKEVIEKTLGKEHPDYADSYNNLAILYFTQKLYQKAEPLYKEVIQNKKEQIQLSFPTLSESEKEAYFSSISFLFSNFTNFATKYYPQNKKISQDLFNYQLFTKGIIFSSTQKMKEQILNSKDSVLINQYEEWKTKKTDYISLIQAPISERDSSINLIEMASQINELEREVSKKSELFKSNTDQKEYTWKDVKNSLDKNEATIEIIRLEKRDVAQNPDTVYVALIITDKTKVSPELLALENGNELENDALSFYQNNIDFQLEDEESYNQYWKPIQDKLDDLSKNGYSKIYFSPDGIYHKINLNTLKNPKTKEFLVEEQNIQLITSSRDLIERKEKGIKNIDLSKNFAAYKTYLLGYPAYNLNGKDTLKINGEDRSLNGLQRVVGQQTVVPILEGTKVETNQINDLFAKKNVKTTLLQNKEATEDNIKELENPTILHIATHGFFINQIPESEVTTMQEAEDRNLLKNPFLRSGLLLAGCQNPQVGKEDGILSAEEAMNLNLDETELVILSACETGLGDIENGEGVFGLQRAFRQAGAKTLIMSLWKVSDDATQLLMVTFYKNLLEGKSKREAFKIAQLKLKEKYSEPYYWGAFVMVGE